jgi:hypothetical protein
MWAGKLGPSSERGGKAARWREGWLDVVRGEVLPAGLLGGVFQPRSRLQRLPPSSPPYNFGHANNMEFEIEENLVLE